MRAVENVSASVFVSFIREHVEPGSTMHMDEFKSYLWLIARTRAPCRQSLRTVR